MSQKQPPFRERRFLHVLCAIYVLIWIVAAIDPVKRSDWLLENLLVFALVPVLIAIYRRVSLSNVAAVHIFLFLLLHAAGAHYMYSEVPLGWWMKETFHLQRNHYDRIVHLSFGLLWTYPFHEMFRGMTWRGCWRSILPAAVVVSMSGLFEIIEAIVAWVVDPELGADYLGIQGDVWDAQKDMALAIGGAALVAFVISRLEGRRTAAAQGGRPR